MRVSKGLGSQLRLPIGSTTKKRVVENCASTFLSLLSLNSTSNRVSISLEQVMRSASGKCIYGDWRTGGDLTQATPGQISSNLRVSVHCPSYRKPDLYKKALNGLIFTMSLRDL